MINNRRIIISILCGILIVSQGCIISYAQQIIDEQTISQNATWTVCYYLCGDNKLSSSQQHSLNLIQSVGSSNEVNIAVLIDKNTDGDTRLYYLNGNDLEQQSWEEESAMDDPLVLQNVVTKVMGDLPSDKFYLHISSNKGSGWQGVCYDQRGDGTMITMSEISQVFSEVTNNGQNKIDVISIGTCLGGNLELAYELHPFCHYYVGYADCGVSGGWPLLESLQALIDDPSMDSLSFSSRIIDVFTPQDIPQWKLMTALGSLDMSKIVMVKDSMDALAQYFIENMDQYTDRIHNALESIRIYGEMWDIFYYIDLVQFLQQISFLDQNGEDLKTDVLSAIDSLVINKKSLEYDDSEGFNVYLPRSKTGFNHALRYDNGILPLSYQQISFARDSKWDEFLMTFLDLECNNPPSIPSINGPQEGKIGETYKYTITTTDPENDQIYYLLDWGDGSLQEWQGPFDSGQSCIVSHNWSNEDTFIIQVKARDENGLETEWETFQVTMNKVKKLFSTCYTILQGKIADIEENSNGDFRFLPIKLLIMNIGGSNGFSIELIDDSYGGYPCCGYIKESEFKGMIFQKFISGIWII